MLDEPPRTPLPIRQRYCCCAGKPPQQRRLQAHQAVFGDYSRTAPRPASSFTVERRSPLARSEARSAVGEDGRLSVGPGGGAARARPSSLTRAASNGKPWCTRDIRRLARSGRLWSRRPSPNCSSAPCTDPGRGATHFAHNSKLFIVFSRSASRTAPPGNLQPPVPCRRPSTCSIISSGVPMITAPLATACSGRVSGSPSGETPTSGQPVVALSSRPCVVERFLAGLRQMHELHGAKVLATDALAIPRSADFHPLPEVALCPALGVTCRGRNDHLAGCLITGSSRPPHRQVRLLITGELQTSLA